MYSYSGRKRTNAPFYLIGALVAVIMFEAVGMFAFPTFLQQVQRYVLVSLFVVIALMLATHGLMDAADQKHKQMLREQHSHAEQEAAERETERQAADEEEASVPTPQLALPAGSDAR